MRLRASHAKLKTEYAKALTEEAELYGENTRMRVARLVEEQL